MSKAREDCDRAKGATLGTPFILNGKSHDLVLSGRKTRGRRVGEILVENKELRENLDRCPRFKRNARKMLKMVDMDPRFK